MSSDGLTTVITDLLGDANRRTAKGRVENVTESQKHLLDAIATRAGEVFDAPITQISLIDKHEQTFLISHGFEIDKAPVETSFCAHALADINPVFIVLDTLADERFAQNPFVTGETNIRFYVGCPIVLEDQKVGTICLFDFEARNEITHDQSRLLVDLAWDAAIILGRDQSPNTTNH